MTTKNKKWFNNGAVQVLAESCPDGFMPGRLKMTKEQKHKLRESHLGQTPWNKNKKGLQKAWNKGITTSEEVKRKIGIANKTSWADKTQEERALINKKRSTTIKDKDLETKRKINTNVNRTKKLNHTFNTSKPEEAYYKYLCSKYGQDNVSRQYSDERYPFACDFYIKSEDLFIELNLHWTHGGKLFEKTMEDLAKLAIWQTRAVKSEFYKNAIETWTIRDPLKQKVAKENSLNYKVIYFLNPLEIDIVDD